MQQNYEGNRVANLKSGARMSQQSSNTVSNMGIDSASLLERENAKLRARIAELERLVATDSLTPLFNRRHFMEELERWCWRAHRYGGTYGLLYCDVDRLKAINDIQGHSIGDDVLVAVADTLMGAVRKSDIAARIGGDEFAVLLDSISPEWLVEKTTAMQTLLNTMGIKTSGPTLKVSVSVGSCLIESGSRASEVLNAADQAMYAHKRSKYPA
jgi:diguanylate cyclase (GGDEF)-like protein